MPSSSLLRLCVAVLLLAPGVAAGKKKKTKQPPPTLEAAEAAHNIAVEHTREALGQLEELLADVNSSLDVQAEVAAVEQVAAGETGEQVTELYGNYSEKLSALTECEGNATTVKALAAGAKHEASQLSRAYGLEAKRMKKVLKQRVKEQKTRAEESSGLAVQEAKAAVEAARQLRTARRSAAGEQLGDEEELDENVAEGEAMLERALELKLRAGFLIEQRSGEMRLEVERRQEELYVKAAECMEAVHTATWQAIERAQKEAEQEAREAAEAKRAAEEAAASAAQKAAAKEAAVEAAAAAAEEAANASTAATSATTAAPVATAAPAAEATPAPHACCLAMTAECLACMANVTVAQYCSGHAEVASCQAEQPGSATAQATTATPVATTTAPRSCCRAMTAECLACAAGETLVEFCSGHEGFDMPGCEASDPQWGSSGFLKGGSKEARRVLAAAEVLPGTGGMGARLLVFAAGAATAGLVVARRRNQVVVAAAQPLLG